MIILGFGGSVGGPQTPIPDTGGSVLEKPDAPGGRSVRLNNYNNWFFGSERRRQRRAKLDILSKRDNICFAESWTSVAGDHIKKRNPHAKVYRLYDLCVKNDWDSDWNNPTDLHHMQTPLQRVEIDRNDWWLRDRSGKIVKENDQTWFLDVGKPGFKEAFLRETLERLKGKEFDGVVFDYWAAVMPPGNLPNLLSPESMPAAYPTSQDWFAKAWKPFVEYVTDGLHKAGYRIIGNCVGGYKSTDPITRWQRSRVDGVIYEQGAVGWKTNEGAWLHGRIIERYIDELATDPLEVWFANNGLKPEFPDFERKGIVSLATYYIGIPMSQEKRSYGYAYDWNVFWDPIWDFYIGVPAAPPDKRPGKYFWSRKYTNGLVLLNYEASESFTCNLNRAYKDHTGKVLSGSVTLPAHSAFILAFAEP